MKGFKKFARVLLACCLMAQLVLPAFATGGDEKIYLALGDSISTGYGLSDPASEGFVAKIAGSDKYKDYKLINKAVNGNTADGILNQLTDAADPNYIDPDTLKGADLITITCGGNDMMNFMYDVLIKAYNDSCENEADKIADKDALMAAITGGKAGDILTAAQKVVNEDLVYTPDFQNAAASFEASFTDLITYIRTVNPTTEVIVSTQYHPYQAFSESNIQISVKNNKLFFNMIYRVVGFLCEAVDPCLDPSPEQTMICPHINPVEYDNTGKVTKYEYSHENGTCPGEIPYKTLNSVITHNASDLGYEIAKVYEKFIGADKQGAEYCNAFFSLSPIGYEIDFHPNAKGHAAIADTFLSVEHENVTKGTHVAPTCTEAGYIPYTCTDCGYVRKDPVSDALGHTEVIDKAVAATCTRPGLTGGKHCSVCNEVLVAQEETEMGDHIWVEGTCSWCGITKIESDSFTVMRDGKNLTAKLKDSTDGLSFYAAHYADDRLTEVRIGGVTDGSAEVTFEGDITSGYVKVFFIQNSNLEPYTETKQFTCPVRYDYQLTAGQPISVDGVVFDEMVTVTVDPASTRRGSVDVRSGIWFADCTFNGGLTVVGDFHAIVGLDGCSFGEGSIVTCKEATTGATKDLTLDDNFVKIFVVCEGVTVKSEAAVGVMTGHPDFDFDFVFNGNAFSKADIAPEYDYLGVYRLYENGSVTYAQCGLGVDNNEDYFERLN